ncbi:immunoglobulin domain-containing family protein [Motilibacter aurantiacus]|uniref:hypothetical protein n=1 Tax=Motilibacter aurantiacus TaxID=2714955 RepID=UPI00140CF00B|nr:hypothetical protein [Motilibacter aurantiacus]NHC47167.1 hypothetical protein [Motilibacter aurantiacus]
MAAVRMTGALGALALVAGLAGAGLTGTGLAAAAGPAAGGECRITWPDGSYSMVPCTTPEPPASGGVVGAPSTPAPTPAAGGECRITWPDGSYSMVPCTTPEPPGGVVWGPGTPAPTGPSVPAPQPTPLPTYPASVSAVFVNGTPTVGRILGCSADTLYAEAVAYSWLRNGQPVATGATYRVSAADAGHRLACRAAASNKDGGGTADSPAVLVARQALRNTQRPTISGAARVGALLKATPGRWAPVAAGHRFVWLRDGKPIARATRGSYRPTAADRGHSLSVRVTASRTGYSPLTAASKAVRVRS